MARAERVPWSLVTGSAVVLLQVRCVCRMAGAEGRDYCKLARRYIAQKQSLEREGSKAVLRDLRSEVFVNSRLAVSCLYFQASCCYVCRSVHVGSTAKDISSSARQTFSISSAKVIVAGLTMDMRELSKGLLWPSGGQTSLRAWLPALPSRMQTTKTWPQELHRASLGKHDGRSRLYPSQQVSACELRLDRRPCCARGCYSIKEGICMRASKAKSPLFDRLSPTILPSLRCPLPP